MSEPLKAEFWFSRDYWLTEVEILQIDIVPWDLFMILGLGSGIILLPLTGMNVLVAGLAGFVMAYGASGMIARRRRRALSALDLMDISGSTRVSARIPWSSVTELRISSRSLLIRTNTNRYYRGRIRADLDEATQFIRSRIGERLTTG